MLKPHGTLWLNVGDSYIARGHGIAYSFDPKNPKGRDRSVEQNARWKMNRKKIALKNKDLVGQPWMLAFALRADGWYLRRDIIWQKVNAMPESVRDRPTTAHEYVFLLSKSEHYFYDALAIMEPVTGNAHERGARVNPGASSRMNVERIPRGTNRSNRSYSAAVRGLVEKRNSRSVWSIPSSGYRGAHFATFPERLAERCILAGSSEFGCCQFCGAAFVREVATEYISIRESNGTRSVERAHKPFGSAGYDKRVDTIRSHSGWRQGCTCTLGGAPVPAVVLDPFAGSGTTLLVAHRLGRAAVGIELNPEYVVLAKERLLKEKLLTEAAG